MNQEQLHDLVHEILQRANQEAGSRDFHLVGHCIEYSPERHQGRFLVVGYSTEDENGKVQPFETGWTKVEMPMVGNGWGIQYALKGGATPDKPEAGEECKLSILDAENGLFSASGLTFNDKMTPPGAGQSGGDQTDDPDGTNKLKGGEIILRHESGTFLKFYEDGHVQLSVQDKLVVVAQKDVDVTIAEGDLNVDVQSGNVNVTAEVGDVAVEAYTGNIAIIAESGDIDIESASGGIVTINGDGEVDVLSTGLVDVAAPIVNIVSAAVNIGSGALMQLLNENMLTLFNNHIHADAQGGVTGPPTNPAIPGIESTVNLMAS